MKITYGLLLQTVYANATSVRKDIFACMLLAMQYHTGYLATVVRGNGHVIKCGIS